MYGQRLTKQWQGNRSGSASPTSGIDGLNYEWNELQQPEPTFASQDNNRYEASQAIRSPPETYSPSQTSPRPRSRSPLNSVKSPTSEEIAGDEILKKIRNIRRKYNFDEEDIDYPSDETSEVTEVEDWPAQPQPLLRDASVEWPTQSAKRLLYQIIPLLPSRYNIYTDLRDIIEHNELALESGGIVIGPSQVNQSLRQAAYALSVGEFGGAVDTEDGVHIIIRPEA